MEHKLRSLIAAAILFLFLVLPLRTPTLFWPILILTVLIGVVFLFWVFNEFPSLKRLRENWFIVVFLIVYIISVTTFAYLLSNPFVRALILGLMSFSLYYLFLIASRLKRGYKPTLYLRNIISLVAILEVFVSLSNILWWLMVNHGKNSYLVVIILAFAVTFIISEFLFEVQNIDNSIFYSLALAFGVTQNIWIANYWLVSYPKSLRITNLGVPLPAITASVFFYLFWGISHHRLEGTLTKKVIWEYILIASIFLLILIVTTEWLPK